MRELLNLGVLRGDLDKGSSRRKAEPAVFTRGLAWVYVKRIPAITHPVMKYAQEDPTTADAKQRFSLEAIAKDPAT